MTGCTNIGCDLEAVASVPGYPEPLPKCFDHERDYSDRYGPGGIEPLMSSRASEAWRNGRHTRGAGLAEMLESEYLGNAVR